MSIHESNRIKHKPSHFLNRESLLDEQEESQEWKDFCKKPFPKSALNKLIIPSEIQHSYPLTSTLKGLMDVSMDFNPQKLNAKQWVAEGYFLKKAVTIIAGAGSVGKSLYSVGCAVSLALGETLGDMNPKASKNVMMYALEDDKDELQARVSAYLSNKGVEPFTLQDRLNIVTLNEDALDVDGGLFTVSNRIAKSTQSLGELYTRLDERLGTPRQVDVLFIDPYAELHNGDENDNTVQAAVIGKLKHIARSYNCSVVLIHHSRKDFESSKSASAVRGASAIVNAARVVLMATTMTEDEAALYDIKTDQERESYLSIKRAKSNYFPNGKTEWFKKEVAHLKQLSGETFKAPYVISTVLKETSIEDDPDFLEFIKNLKLGINGVPYSTAPNARETNLNHLLQEFGYQHRREQVEKAITKLGFRKAQFKNKNRTTQWGWQAPNKDPYVDWVS